MLVVAWGTLAGTLAAPFGCHKRAPVPIPEIAPIGMEAPAPTSDLTATDDPRSAVVVALSQRDGEPDCATVEAGLAEPVEVLLDIVAEVRMPPMAPMRAAGCLIALHGADPAVADAIAAWVAGADTKGLALLVGQRLDALPAEVALRAAIAAEQGPWSDVFAPAAAACAHPDVRAVFGP